MKTLIALALLAALAAGCRAPVQYHGDPDEDAYGAVPRTETVKADHRIDPPSGPDIEYLSMSADSKYAFCDWTSSLSEAQAAARTFQQRYPNLDWYVLWRQKPKW